MVPQQRILQRLNRELILTAPTVPADSPLFLKPKSVGRWTYCLHGKRVQRNIIYLRSDVGCVYGLKTGGCTSCRHWRLGTAGARVNIPDMYIKQYLAAVDEHGLPPVVCIYNEGNMLANFELPTDQLLTIVAHLADNGVVRLVIESRTEYITDDILVQLKAAAGPMEVEIGIGLESSNDFIRNELFLKSTSLRSYERAVGLMRRRGVRSLAYAIVKPAFLNEAQGIADAIRTARYAFEVGTDAVSFEPIGVEPHTVTELMYNAGLFVPAWLWSVIEVVKASHHLGEMRIGGFQFDPLPVTLPRNCEACTDRVLEAIDRFNMTYDLGTLLSLACTRCQPKYAEEVAKLSPEIDEAQLAKALTRFVESTQVPALVTL